MSVTDEPECGHMIYEASSSHSEDPSFDAFAQNKATLTFNGEGELKLDFFDLKTYISGTLTVTVTMRQSIAAETVFTRNFEIIFLNCLTEKMTQQIQPDSYPDNTIISKRFGSEFNTHIKLDERYTYETELAK